MHALDLQELPPSEQKYPILGLSLLPGALEVSGLLEKRSFGWRGVAESGEV